MHFAFYDRSQFLVDIHCRLLRFFGRQGPFRMPDPVSQLVLGLVGRKTRGDVSKQACEALWRRYGRWEAVRDAPVRDVGRVIGAVTFANSKAQDLILSLKAITSLCGRLTLCGLEPLSVEDALVWLERLPGVGRKVAAATLNFSTLRKPALVIDTHHLRILRRLGLVGAKCDTRKAYDGVAAVLPVAWSASDLDEHHQLMKRLGQTICRHDEPHCSNCPLQELCPTAVAWSVGYAGMGWRNSRFGLDLSAGPVEETDDAIVPGAAGVFRP